MSSASIPPMRAAAFLDSLGVVTHLVDPAYKDALAVDRMLDYVGIGNVRLNAPYNAEGQAEMVTLAQHGARIDYVINGYGPVYLASTMTMLREQLPYIRAIEMPNEIDIFPITYDGLGGIEAAMKFQRDVYTAIRADHAFDGVPVIGFSIGATALSNYPTLRDMSPYADYANVHSYAPDGIRPAWVLPPSVQAWSRIAPSDPVMVTETGYYTIPGHTGWGGVTENVQSQYLLDTAFGNALRGVARTYFYDLIDDGTNPAERENHFGMFHFDGTAKPVATAFHNLTSILADDGAGAATFATRAVTYSVTGLPFTASSMMLEKSDGTHMLAVWNEEDLWNEATGTEIASRHYDGTVTLDRVYDTVLVFDPTLGDKAIATYRNVSSLHLDVASHPLIVQFGAPVPVVAAPVVTAPVVTAPVVAAPVVAAPVPSAPVLSAPAPAPAAPVTAPSVPASPIAVGSGTDALVVKLSEDAWQGHAQYSIRVDGVQVGGVRTASAARNSGQAEDVTLTGGFGTGRHTVAVEFLNDAFTPGVGDRNLYVHGVTLNGAALPDSGAILYGNGVKAVEFGSAGSDKLTLRMSEDAWGEHAQFTVKVDGAQVGGTNTVTASRAAHAAQDFSFNGDWGAGSHVVTVNFLNDAYGGTAGTDRNLAVEGISLNGQALPGAPAILFGAGPRDFATATDRIVLRISEDAWQGHAQYTVKVDGAQVGGVRTASAAHAEGRAEDVTLAGNWGGGAHKVTVDFLNDAYAPGVGDRNLFVEGIALNGKAVPGASAILFGPGPRDFTVGERQLTVRVSEDAWKGDAQFVVKVDGAQVGGINTATAPHSAGKAQDFTFTGGWGPGHHDVSVDFLNDAFTPGQGDRNLFVEGLSVDGVAQPGIGAVLYAAGPVHFDVLMGG